LIPDALDYYIGITDSFDMMGVDDDDYSDEEGDNDYENEIIVKK
jgi:hypothetical protein